MVSEIEILLNIWIKTSENLDTLDKKTLIEADEAVHEWAKLTDETTSDTYRKRPIKAMPPSRELKTEGEVSTEVIYNFIDEYIQEHGYPPSQREIADNLYISLPSVIRYLNKLRAQGRIILKPGVARGIILTGATNE